MLIDLKSHKPRRSGRGKNRPAGAVRKKDVAIEQIFATIHIYGCGLDAGRYGAAGGIKRCKNFERSNLN